MPYAANNKISTTPFDGSVEITDSQYRELLNAQINGKKFIIRDNSPIILSDTKRTVYKTEDGSKKEIAENDDTPEGYTDQERPSEFHYWENDSWVRDDEKFLEAEKENVRNKRDSLLRETDYLFLGDYPLNDDKKTEWESYRQSLRDITEQSGFPEDVEWPEKP